MKDYRSQGGTRGTEQFLSLSMGTVTKKYFPDAFFWVACSKNPSP